MKPTIVLLDGGLGQEVFRRANQPAHPLWSTKIMMNRPELVKSVHQDFILAGARIITVNTYTATPSRLARDGRPDWFVPLQEQALSIAEQARAELGAVAQGVQIAGCLSPLMGSYVADERPRGQLCAEYQQIAQIQAPRVDLFLIETIASIQEARVATEVALAFGKPVLLSLSLSDQAPHTLRSGEPILEATQALMDYPLRGLLFNCSFPETITSGLRLIQGGSMPYGGYANGFTSVSALKPGGTVDSLTARTDLNEAIYSQHVKEWIRLGATIVGGCCEVGPSYIAHLHRELEAEGYVLGRL